MDKTPAQSISTGSTHVSYSESVSVSLYRTYSVTSVYPNMYSYNVTGMMAQYNHAPPPPKSYII